MKLFDRFKKIPTRYEFLTNLVEGSFMNGLEQTNTGRGCPVSSTKTMENLDMDAEGKQLLKEIADELNNPATQKAIRDRFTPAPKVAPKPEHTPTAEQTREARETVWALLQEARDSLAVDEMNDELAAKYGFKVI